MKVKRMFPVLVLMALLLIPSCTREEAAVLEEKNTYYQEIERPGYQKDKSLLIALDTDFGTLFNPFSIDSRGEEIIDSVIFTSPLISNSRNELIPWNGNMLSGSNADGSVSFIVTLDENMYFTDGTPITIDDYIYSLYVKADPSYRGSDPLTDLDIRGIWNYYYDDNDWEENLRKLRFYAKDRYSSYNITQDDFTDYLSSSRLEGKYDLRTADEWKEILLAEGWTSEVEGIRTDEDLQELVALYEYAENADEYDPYTWYWNMLEEEYIENNLSGESHVETIEGIEKINSHACRITLDSVTPDTQRRLNTFIVPHHYYGTFQKGDILSVLEKHIPLGSGPYTFYAAYDDKVVLKSNDRYKEGIPNIGTVTFMSMSEDRIVSALQVGALDIGLLAGNEETLEKLKVDTITTEPITRGAYPSIFISSDIDEKDRIQLYDVIQQTVKYLPLSALNRKMDLPISPLIPEYPDNIKVRRDDVERIPVDGGRVIRILVDEELPQNNIGLFVRNLHTELRLIGNTLETVYMPREEILQDMMEGKADAAIIPSFGTLYEKAQMYHSEGEANIQHIDDPVFDEIFEKLLSEPTLDERRKLTSMIVERIMSEGLEVPLYQNRAIIAYNSNNLDMESVPEVSSVSWNFLSSLWRLRKK